VAMEHQPPPDANFREWLYTLRWEACPRSSRVAETGAGSSRWLLFGDSGGMGAALAATIQRRGDHCQLVRTGQDFSRKAGRPWTVDPRRLDDIRTLIMDAARSRPSLAGVVFAWALDAPPLATMGSDELAVAQERTACGALHVARALSEARTAGIFGGRLWFVTRNAQRISETDPPSEAVQALLWGLGRSLAHESRGLWGGLIDLAPRATRTEVEAVAAELLWADGEDQVAFRAGTRLAPRLTRFTLQTAERGPSIFRPDATYLITGGLGTIGLRTAEWLVEHEGVRALLLTGRRGERDQIRPALETLRRHGARVLVIPADVSIAADVRRLMEVLRDLPPLRGIIHGAGVLDNEIVEHLDWERFVAVTRPKVEGAWLLHQATRDHQLDFFVVQSSLLSLTGSAGQSNYTAGNAFLDSLVSHRQALGLPATAINWTAWDEQGLAASVGARAQEAWRVNGWRYIAPDAAVRVFAQLMRPPVDRVAVIIADWSRYLQHVPHPSPLYSGLVGTAVGPAAPSDTDVRQHLAGVREADRRAALIEFLGRQVMEAMGFDEQIDARRPLSDVGLDSLMAVNVAARLETALGIPVPVVKLIRGPSIEQLVDDLAPRLATFSTPVVNPATNGVAAVPPAAGASKVAGHGWLVFPRPNPSAQMRLFCFPYAGGNAATYRPWAEALDAGVELVAVDPPGRANRIHEAPIDNLEGFLIALVAAMSLFLDKPAAFFGHCLGGLTAFEAARRLQRQGSIDLRHLFVSGARSPRRLNRFGRFEEDLLTNLLKHPEFDARVALYDQAEGVVAEMIRHFNIGLTKDFLASAELRTLLMPAIRAEFRMGAHYRFTSEPSWDAAITCFTGVDDPYVSREDALGWSEHTRRIFCLHLRAGAHFLVVDDRDFIVETINRELRA
jgi:surfactin synthase thioesterase subunit/NAD(P)-dependent dehydrogenase (short-subunit alcohol dehydrogenase family)